MDISSLGLELQALYNAFGEWDIAVSELYGPGRFTSRATAFSLQPGSAMDLTTRDERGNPRDFNAPAMRAKAK